jgi:hypothetical protein
LQQIAVRRRDHPHVDADELFAAQPLKRMSFQNAQQLGLAGLAHFSDFIQEQRAAVRAFELADVSPVGAGERAGLVAEQFAFQQRLAERRAVHGDVGPRAVAT